MAPRAGAPNASDFKGLNGQTIVVDPDGFGGGEEAVIEAIALVTVGDLQRPARPRNSLVPPAKLSMLLKIGSTSW
jgi:hypothetical protein